MRALRPIVVFQLMTVATESRRAAKLVRTSRRVAFSGGFQGKTAGKHHTKLADNGCRPSGVIGIGGVICQATRTVKTILRPWRRISCGSHNLRRKAAKSASWVHGTAFNDAESCKPSYRIGLHRGRQFLNRTRTVLAIPCGVANGRFAVLLTNFRRKSFVKTTGRSPCGNLRASPI